MFLTPLLTFLTFLNGRQQTYIFSVPFILGHSVYVCGVCVCLVCLCACLNLKCDCVCGVRFCVCVVCICGVLWSMFVCVSVCCVCSVCICVFVYDGMYRVGNNDSPPPCPDDKGNASTICGVYIERYTQYSKFCEYWTIHHKNTLLSYEKPII